MIFTWGKYNYHKNSSYKQNLLLKAMQHTTNVHEMKRLTGIKTVAEVYRTLDKIAIRKEYHVALANQGIDLNTIISGIKDLCVNSNSDQVKLGGYRTLLRSLGLDEYRESDSNPSSNWEEKMKDIVQNEIDNSRNKDDQSIEIKDYEVIAPEAPEEEKEKEKEEKNLGVSLYE